MSLVNISKDYFDKGVFLFENGRYIFIEEVEYSGDGQYWEKEFEPLDHPDPRNLNEILLGHVYRRVRHAGDDYFQKPMYFVPKDGKSLVFKMEGGKLYQKYAEESDDMYVELFDTVELKGDKGDVGDKGTGLHIDSAGYYNAIPDCNESTCNTTVSTCTTCSDSSPKVVTDCDCTGKTFLCLGKSDGTDSIEGVLSVDDIVLNSPVIGEHTLSYGDKTVRFSEVDIDDIPNGVIYIGEEVLAKGTAAITSTGAVGDVFNLLVDGNVVASYTTNGTETIADIANSLAVSMGSGYTGLAFGAASLYVYCPIGSGVSGDSRVLTLVTTGTAAGSVVTFSGGVTRGAHTVEEQLNKILTITDPTGYVEEGISSGIEVTRLLTSGTIDGNLTIGNTGAYITHTIVTRGIEYIAGVIDIRLPGETPVGDQTGDGLRGNVYVCTSAGWIAVMNIAAPEYKMAPTEDYANTEFNGLYMEDYVVPLYTVTPDDGGTIVMNDTTFLLGIKMNSVEAKHLKDGTFGDGLYEGEVGVEGYKLNTIRARVDDFDGFGLKTYVSTADGYTDLQLDIVDVLGDGLISFDDNGFNNANRVDDEDRILARVNVDDIISPTTAVFTGLWTSTDAGITETDAFDNIYVKAGDAIGVDTKGVNIVSDELSLTSIDASVVKVYETDSLTLGVQAKHLHKNGVNELHGLKKDNDTTGAYSIILSTDHKSLDFDIEGLKLTNHTVEGWHLNHNVADTAKGIKMDETTDMLEVLLKDAGGIMFDGGELAIDTADLSWLDDFIVKKIEIWEYRDINNQGDVSGDLVLRGDQLQDMYMSVRVLRTGQLVEIVPETNLANLTQLIEDVIDVHKPSHTYNIDEILGLQDELDSKIPYSEKGANNGVATLEATGKIPASQLPDLSAHDHSILEVVGLQDELDDKVNKDYTYSNFKVTDSGMYLKSNNDTWFRVAVDDSGNLFTE